MKNTYYKLEYNFIEAGWIRLHVNTKTLTTMKEEIQVRIVQDCTLVGKDRKNYRIVKITEEYV